MTRPVVVLVGAPGAGKTTVGTTLAARLGVTFRDTDADVERTAGKPVADIFVQDGEPRFRALEVAAVAAALSEHTGVLALGGGAVLDQTTRTRLSGHTVVHLDVDLTDSVARVGLARSRPVLALNPRATLQQLLVERRPHYESVATSTVATTGRTVDDVVDAVLEALR